MLTSTCLCSAVVDSLLLTSDHVAQLESWIRIGSEECAWRLLFRATCDGFTKKAFSERCYNKGATLTVARVAGTATVLGGFTSVAWTGGPPHYKNDARAFLISTCGRVDDRFTSYPVKYGGQHAIYDFTDQVGVLRDQPRSLKGSCRLDSCCACLRSRRRSAILISCS